MFGLIVGRKASGTWKSISNAKVTAVFPKLILKMTLL